MLNHLIGALATSGVYVEEVDFDILWCYDFVLLCCEFSGAKCVVTCDHSTQEAKAGLLRLWDHSGLCDKI